MAEEANGSTRKTKVFISYSRKDKEFVKKLNDAVDASGIDAWVDWEGIELASDWMQRITAAIEGGDAFLFVISPDSLASKVCRDELELGIKCNKKVIPILFREPEKGQEMHQKLSSTNWVYMRAQDDFDATIPKLVNAIQTDLGWIQQHTRLLQRAGEWEQKGHNNSYLLQGQDLDEGEKWMLDSTRGESRQVVPLQAEYISKSRKIAVQRQRNLIIGVMFALIVSIAASIYAFGQRNLARQSEAFARSSEKTAVANEHIAATQKAVAEDNYKLALINENQAKAQKSAALASIYKDRPGELDTSTLLAIESWLRSPSDEAESILRDNSTLLPTPVAHVQHGTRIARINPSEDGQFFVTASKDNTACVWTISGEQKFCAKHNGEVSEAFLTKDNKILITSGEDGYVRLWDMTSDQPIKEFKYGSFVRDMDINPESTMVAVGLDDGKVSIIDLATEENTHELKLSEGAVFAVKFNPSGTWLGIGTSSGQVRIWDPVKDVLLQGATHSSEVYDISFSADGKYMVSGGADSTARLTKTEAGGEVFAFKHGDWVEDTAFGPDSSWFAAASDDNLVHVWDTNTGAERLRLQHGSYVLRVAVSPDGQWILSTGYDKTAKLWDAVSGTLVREMPLEDNGWAVAFAPDEKHIFTGDLKGNVVVWDISDLVARVGYIQAPEIAHKVKFSSSQGWFIFNTDDRKLWQMPTDQITNVHDLSAAKEILTLDKITVQFKLSPNSEWAALSLYDADRAQRALLFNIKDQTKYYLPHDTDITGLGFSSDSKYLATTNRDGKNVFIWDVATGELSNTLPLSEVAFTSTFNPVSINQLVVGLSNKAVIYDITTGKEIAQIIQIGEIRSINFSKDGAWLATASSDGSISIWDAKNNNFTSPVYTFLQGGSITSMEFSPDIKYLATGSSNGNAYLWELQAGEEIVRIGHNNPVEGVSFTPDGTKLVTVSRKVIQVWDISKFTPIRRDKLIETACSSLIRNFSSDEWEFFFGDDEPHKLCETLP